MKILLLTHHVCKQKFNKEKLSNMKRLLFLITMIVTVTLGAKAQGSVTVTQSAEIDALVNGKKDAKKTTKERPKGDNQRDNSRGTASTSPKVDTKQLKVPQIKEQLPKIESPERKVTQPTKPAGTKIVKRLVRRPHDPTWDAFDDTELVTKRVRMVNSKVRGFRVQVYSGGNTREAHQQADKAGQKAKALFPNQPVYVHFYSPRWMCLVGNFTNYNEAKKLVNILRKEGYPHANVIRMMVTVRTSKDLNK